MESPTSRGTGLVATGGADLPMIRAGAFALTLCLGFSWNGSAEENNIYSNVPARLSISPRPVAQENPAPFIIPLPAHAQPMMQKERTSFAVESSRKASPLESARNLGSAEYLLPEDKKSNPITPEMANLNLPTDTVLIAKDTGEKIVLPAGTYRQIMKLPIDSPLMAEDSRSRELRSPTIQTDQPKSRYAPPPVEPIWVRYESLEKITIGDQERRGGLDIPSHGPVGLGPRVWYAKSETADLASSAFYFVFGGLGYGIANLAGWSAGNTRDIPNDFEYRLIRK